MHKKKPISWKATTIHTSYVVTDEYRAKEVGQMACFQKTPGFCRHMHDIRHGHISTSNQNEPIYLNPNHLGG